MEWYNVLLVVLYLPLRSPAKSSREAIRWVRQLSERASRIGTPFVPTGLHPPAVLDQLGAGSTRATTSGPAPLLASSPFQASHHIVPPKSWPMKERKEKKKEKHCYYIILFTLISFVII